MNNRACSLLIILLVWSFGARAAHTDPDSTGRYIWSIGADVRPAALLPTSAYFRGHNPLGRHPFASLSADLKTEFSFSHDSGCIPSRYLSTYQGLAVGYSTFFQRQLIGNPLSVYIYQGFPVATLTDRMALFAEWEFGAAFGWHTQRTLLDPSGINGSATTARLGLNLLLRYQLNSAVTLITGIDLTHFSNGNTRFPNAGTNTAALRLGLSYRLTSDRDRSLYRTPFHKPFEAGTNGLWSYDLLIYGAAHKRFFRNENDEAIPLPGCFAVAGATFAPMRHFASGALRAGVSLDMQWDEGADLERYVIDDMPGDHPVYHRPPFWRQIGIGASIHGEIVLPYFAINVGIGRNIYAPAPD